MNRDLTSKEYSTLRDELLKWQDRRITFSQITLTLVTAYAGYMLRDEKNSTIETTLSWQTVSIFPLLILSITIHLNIVFELFQIRIAAFLSVFYDSTWEKFISKSEVSLSEGSQTLGYNKSMAIIYLVIVTASILIFMGRYKSPFYVTDSIFFLFFSLVFLYMFYRMYSFGTNNHRGKFLSKWEAIKKEAKAEELPDLSNTELIEITK